MGKSPAAALHWVRLGKMKKAKASRDGSAKECGAERQSKAAEYKAAKKAGEEVEEEAVPLPY